MTPSRALPTFHETQQRLTMEVEDGSFTIGAQVEVRLGDRIVASFAVGDDGTGRPMCANTIMRVYCTIKPVTALAVGKLVADGSVALDEPLAPLLPSIRCLSGRVTLRQVLTHTAGLHRPAAVEVELTSTEKRRSLIDDTARPPGWPANNRAAYSEWLGWQVLGRLLEAVTGTPLRDHLRTTVLDPLGLQDTWIGMTPEDYRANRHRIGISHELRGLQTFPLLLERGERLCTETNPAHGGYTTAGDLARLYSAVLRVRAGGHVDGLPDPGTIGTFTSPARERVFDEVLDRPCTYGLGFMTALGDHAFGNRPSPGSFGHSGNVGASFAFADPAHDLAVAAVFNGLVDHESAFLRRQVIVNAVYRDLETVASPRPPAATDGPPPHRRWWRR